ncbi:MAG: trypsin-like peptidase domain-containing protein [Oscillospiraceae bacterium]|nr:trypsin-like peptidase domain-containing protein [Oscillospiraceae bacterium]
MSDKFENYPDYRDYNESNYQYYENYNGQPYREPIRSEIVYAPAKKKRGFFSYKKRPGAVVAACLIGSMFFGFVGTYAANSLNGGGAAGTVRNRGSVIYQSVVNTSGGEDAHEKYGVIETAAAVLKSVVEISTETVVRGGRLGQYVSTGAGSGVIITADGYIVTNNHVVSGAQSIFVRLTDGTGYEASLVGADAKTDLAVIKINASGLQAAVLGNSSMLEVGETAIAIGNPLGELGGTVTEGIISALDREIKIDGESMSLLQTSAAINPGNSGGGLFSLSGELVGIVNAKSSGSDIEGLGFAIPIDTAKHVIEDIITNGYVRGRVDTGLTLIEVNDAFTAMQYRVNKLGLYIYKSQNGNFQPGDIITAVDGAAVNSLDGFNGIIGTHEVGDTVKITVTRDGGSVEQELTLIEQKPY